VHTCEGRNVVSARQKKEFAVRFLEEIPNYIPTSPILLLPCLSFGLTIPFARITGFSPRSAGTGIAQVARNDAMLRGMTRCSRCQ